MKKLFFILVFSTFFMAGCISFGSRQPSSVAGVFKSFDNGDNWIEKNLFLHGGGVATISGTNVIDLVFDPQDPRAIYLTSDGAGLFHSYDSGDSWRKAEPVGNGRIEAVAIDPKNKCVIYSSFANTIIKSTDCSRTWAEVYIDTRADKAITAVSVDHFDNLIIYAGNTIGDILKSVDGGGNWRVIERLNNPIKKILIDPNDSRIIYAATQARGIFKTISAGADWFEVNAGLTPYSGSFEYKDLIFDKTQKDSLMLVSKYGMIKTNDGGSSWEPLTLITPPTTVDIFSVAISPFNNQDIYYATASTFYRTSDGGQNWITKRLPSGAVATHLEVDPVNAGVLYLGMTNFTK